VVFGKDEAVKMVEVRGQRIVVERENGERFAFDPKRIHSFDVGEARKISVASGDRLLIRGNLKAKKVKNGDIVEVIGFDADGSIRLKDGRSTRNHAWIFNGCWHMTRTSCANTSKQHPSQDASSTTRIAPRHLQGRFTQTRAMRPVE
jgi:hypothetical protein